MISAMTDACFFGEKNLTAAKTKCTRLNLTTGWNFWLNNSVAQSEVEFYLIKADELITHKAFSPSNQFLYLCSVIE